MSLQAVALLRRVLPWSAALERDEDRQVCPLALGTLGDGREVVVHCPDEYNVLQIEGAASG
ncbi:hypothetical protein [Streptomyces canus]|uniref:hypothetical protein n=1 Tax=Streptomyces canus TaxID=58343 RepID=UPI002E34A51E|nr:hypothetical protein [Streptomyces canus]